MALGAIHMGNQSETAIITFELRMIQALFILAHYLLFPLYWDQEAINFSLQKWSGSILLLQTGFK